jgi:hypothetical protein
MDSNFWYRGTKAQDFRSIPGMAGDTTLGNSARKPSPVFLTMRARCSWIFGSTSSFSFE